MVSLYIEVSIVYSISFTFLVVVLVEHFPNVSRRKEWREGKRAKNSREVILFSIERSSCTLLTPKTRAIKALNNKVQELRI